MSASKGKAGIEPAAPSRPAATGVPRSAGADQVVAPADEADQAEPLAGDHIFSGESVELDAVDPRRLRDLVRRELTPYARDQAAGA